MFMVRAVALNATFNYISVVSWRKVILVEDTTVHTSSHNIISSTPQLSGVGTHNVMRDRH